VLPRRERSVEKHDGCREPQGAFPLSGDFPEAAEAAALQFAPRAVERHPDRRLLAARYASTTEPPAAVTRASSS
jgi:hypothetical protein